MTPVEESPCGHLTTWLAKARFLYIGVSDAPRHGGLRKPTRWPKLRGWTKFIGLQIEYSLIERTVER